ncbi:MAG: hypothetical protein ACRDNH_07150 [Gaiellaceae bacterium]
MRREREAYVAEEDGQVIGSAQMAPGGGVVLELAVPREGVALALLRAVAAERSRDAGEEERPASHGSVHLQTDNQAAVVQAVSRLVPRVFRSEATVVSAPRNGWIAVYDEVTDRDPRQLARLGRELSNATGLVVFTIGVEEATAVHYIAFERGRTLDEYLSVPDYRGPLPPGDAIALRANPTVVARLTGANAASVRSVARTAASPDELPPADELLREVALALGLEGTHVRFDEARYLPDAVVVEHE